MARKLVPVRRLIEDAQDAGLDLDQIFVDPDDLVEVEVDESDEE